MSIAESKCNLINALNWNFFTEHCSQVANGNLTVGSKCFHITMATLEFFPVISQIVSLFELFVNKIIYLLSYSAVERETSIKAELAKLYNIEVENLSNLDLLESEYEKEPLIFDQCSNYIFTALSHVKYNGVLESLQDRCKDNSSKKCHIGVASFFNFEEALATKVKKIIIIDKNPNMVKFNRIVRNLLISCDNDQEFKAQLVKRCDRELQGCKYYGHFSKTPEEHHLNKNSLSSILNEEGSCFDEKGFAELRSIARNRNFHIFRFDFFNEDQVNTFVERVNQEECEVNTMFLSNMSTWIQDNHGPMQKSVNKIKSYNPNSLIIEAVNSQDKNKKGLEIRCSSSSSRWRPS